MKKTFLITTALLFTFVSCNKRYTQQSKEIDTFKKVTELYGDGKFDEMAVFYADSAKIINNVPDEFAQTVQQRIAQNKEESLPFSIWKINKTKAEYEMVVTDKGEIWVNYWGQWEGTLRSNNKMYIIPTSITARFVDGKITREVGYWDDSKLLTDLQQAETVSNIEIPDQLKMAKK